MKSCKNSHTELAYILEAFEHIDLDASLEKQSLIHSDRINSSTTKGSTLVFPWAKLLRCLWAKIHYPFVFP